MVKTQLMSAVDGGADAVSAPLDLGEQTVFAIQVQFSGSNLAGTLKLQIKVDDTLSWIDLPDSSQSVTSATPHVWNMVNAGFTKVRVSWTYSSGSGTITAYSNIKEAGKA